MGGRGRHKGRARSCVRRGELHTSSDLAGAYRESAGVVGSGSRSRSRGG